MSCFDEVKSSYEQLIGFDKNLTHALKILINHTSKFLDLLDKGIFSIDNISEKYIILYKEVKNE